MTVLTSLAENDYFLGLAALLNSVAEHGKYVDRVIVGYRGELPSWLPELTATEHGYSFVSKSGFQVDLIRMEGKYHMVHEKPKWLWEVTEVLAPGADEYFFFDSDIVINCRMEFFGEWVRLGVALCGDVNFVFDATHPHRRVWAGFAEKEGRKIHNQLNGYYNSGFLGWTQKTKSFVSDWNDAFQMMVPHSGNMREFRVYDRTHPVLTTNQDSFNLAAMITTQPLSLVGPEAMSFSDGMRLMHHPIGPKPWRRNYFLGMLKGKPPRASDVAFWRSVNGSEFSPVSRLKQQWMIFICLAFRFLARFYKAL
ncbi:hypothetical protein [Neolewinella antarctica]|uniref:Uncharacterized protein n=1 Tax=Neolewinella antarctica TaxID=442734 RepID=A0ABX0XCL0_9BACT|nr:hypothetical protein [Neolewinella antarctica]NJC26654.1 hypothetical protein [Neolewinella antarctica]